MRRPRPILKRFDACSPGALLLEHAIGEAVRTAAGEFDFLRGAEAYKYRWGARDRPQYRLRVEGASAARRGGASGAALRPDEAVA